MPVCVRAEQWWQSPGGPMNHLYIKAFYVSRVLVYLENILLDCKPFEDRDHLCLSCCFSNLWLWVLGCVFVCGWMCWSVSWMPHFCSVAFQTRLCTSVRLVPFFSNWHTTEVSRESNNFGLQRVHYYLASLTSFWRVILSCFTENTNSHFAVWFPFIPQGVYALVFD